MSLADAFDTMAAVAGAAFGAMFPDLCAVQSPTNTQGSSGGNRPSWANVTGLSSVPCLYSSRRGMERDAAGALTAFTDFEILMPSEVSGTLVSVAPKYRIMVAARGTQPARTFEVVSVASEAGVYWRVAAVLRNA
jgi:hypothetical protein